jgi:hypothetical protein
MNYVFLNFYINISNNFLILRFSERDLSKNVHYSSNKVTVFYILLTVHLDVILVDGQLDAIFVNVFISCLYMFRATSANHQEGQIVLIHHLV